MDPLLFVIIGILCICLGIPLLRFIILNRYGKDKMRIVFTIISTGKKVKTAWVWRDDELIEAIFDSLTNENTVPFKVDSSLDTNIFSTELLLRSFIEVKLKKAFFI